MSTNKILLAGLVGAVAAFILGFLTWGLLLNEFMSNNAGSTTGIMRTDDEMLWIPMVVGHLAWGLLFAIIFGRWAGISTFVTGAKAGAVLGFLIALSYDMISLGSTHMMSFTAVLVDVVASTIVTAIVGGIIGWFLGRETK